MRKMMSVLIGLQMLCLATVSSALDELNDSERKFMSGAGIPSTEIRSFPGASGSAKIEIPPDPGEAGKVTLDGIDSDNNGVRDDIQRYIALTYFDKTDIQKALIQLSKSIHSAIVDTTSTVSPETHAREIIKSVECLYALNPFSAREVHAYLMAEYLNTVERSRAYADFNLKIAGKRFSLSCADNLKLSCDFLPDEGGSK